MAAVPDVLDSPPDAVPEQYKDQVELLHQQVLTIFQSKEIPYFIMARMASDGYRSVEDLADRWPTITEARNNSPADLQFRHTDRGGALITQEKTNHLAMRISQCVRQAQQLLGTGGLNQGRVGPAGLLPTTSQAAPSLDALCDRRQLLQTWTVVVQLPLPRLEDQGSDALLKKQFKLCAQGEVGWIASKYIISALPDQDERPIKTTKKVTVDGWEKEEEEETRKLPTTRRQLEHMHLVFRTNLLMAILSFPSMPKLNITHRDLEDWYRWFWGKDIADRRPPPSEQVLLYAERNAWREIHNLVYGGLGLKEAMAQLRQDTLFWTREVYESVARQKGNKGSGPDSANLRGHQLSHNGTNKKGHPKGVRPKGPWDPEKGRTLNGLQTGLRSHPREYSTAVTTSSRRNVPGTADAPTTVRSSRMAGYATPHPQNTPQSNAHTVDSWRTR